MPAKSTIVKLRKKRPASKKASYTRSSLREGVRVNTYVEKRQFVALQRLARKKGVSTASLIRQGIEEVLAQ